MVLVLPTVPYSWMIPYSPAHCQGRSPVDLQDPRPWWSGYGRRLSTYTSLIPSTGAIPYSNLQLPHRTQVSPDQVLHHHTPYSDCGIYQLRLACPYPTTSHVGSDPSTTDSADSTDDAVDNTLVQGSDDRMCSGSCCHQDSSNPAPAVASGSDRCPVVPHSPSSTHYQVYIHPHTPDNRSCADSHLYSCWPSHRIAMQVNRYCRSSAELLHQTYPLSVPWSAVHSSNGCHRHLPPSRSWWSAPDSPQRSCPASHHHDNSGCNPRSSPSPPAYLYSQE